MNILSFDYNNNQINRIFNDENPEYKGCHYSVKIIEQNIIRLLESSLNGIFRIWYYNSGNLLERIKVCDEIYDFCYFGDENIIIGSLASIVLLNLKNKKILDFSNISSKKKVTLQGISFSNNKIVFASQNLYGKIELYIIKTFYI